MGRIKKQDTTVIVLKRGCEQPATNTQVVPRFASAKEAQQGHPPLCTLRGKNCSHFSRNVLRLST